MNKKDLGKVGFCLAGAGSRGIWQAGALKALEEKGIKPDCVFGSSSGTLNSLIYSMGDMKKLEDMWMNIRTDKVYKKSLCTKLDALTSKACLYDSSPLLQLIKDSIDVNVLRKISHKLFIGTTDLTNFTSLTFEISELEDDEIPIYAFASASPPVFFPPVKFRNLNLTDSGVAQNYHLLNAIQQNCDTVILISPSIIEPRPINNLADMVKSTMAISMQTYLSREIRAIQKVNAVIDAANEYLPDEHDFKKINLIDIISEHPIDVDFLDFEYKGHKREDLMMLGYVTAKKKLEQAGI